MDNVKNDDYYANRILDDLAFIIRHMDGIDKEAFSKNELLQDSMMFRLIQISENARKLTETYRKSHPTFPWSAVFGLRNRIVHDYGNVVLDVVFDTLKKDIPDLLKSMRTEFES